MQVGPSVQHLGPDPHWMIWNAFWWLFNFLLCVVPPSGHNFHLIIILVYNNVKYLDHLVAGFPWNQIWKLKFWGFLYCSIALRTNFTLQLQICCSLYPKLYYCGILQPLGAASGPLNFILVSYQTSEKSANGVRLFRIKVSLFHECVFSEMSFSCSTLFQYRLLSIV